MAKENEKKEVKKKGAGTSKKKKNVILGNITILVTFNNTIVSVTDGQGNVIAWSSSGKLGFAGSKKATPYVAQLVASDAISKAKEYGLQTANIIVRGPGAGKESALRALQGSGVSVIKIVDSTYYPHNGCRPSKKRRM